MFTYEMQTNQKIEERQDVACVLLALGAHYELVETRVEQRWFGDLPYYDYVITADSNAEALQAYCELVDNSDCMR